MAGGASEKPPVVLVWGDDDFAVKRRAREVFQEWTAAAPGADGEIIEGTAGNTDEVHKVLGRVREALNTLPFFGGAKSVWFRDCNFLGEDRVSETQAVVDAASDWVRELAAFRWSGVRLLISAGRMDRRRSYFKGLDKLAVVEHFPGLSGDDRDWREKAQNVAAAEFREAGRRIGAEALSAFVEQVGPNARMLSMEARKLVAYVGDRAAIGVEDVEAIVTRNRSARAFALGDAFGERQLPRVLKHLDDELWAMRSDRQKSEIGLLYGLIGKVRAMLLAKEMEREGWLKPVRDYGAFAAQVAAAKARLAPEGGEARKNNPLDLNPYVLFRASQQARNFTREELVAAMAELLQCNRRLVGSTLDGEMVLQLTLVRLLAGGEAGGAGRLAGRPVRT